MIGRRSAILLLLLLPVVGGLLLVVLDTDLVAPPGESTREESRPPDRREPEPGRGDAPAPEAGVTAAESVYVGDNWLADVQGARRAGLQSVFTTQWEPAADHEPLAGDLPAHCTIGHFSELLDHL